MKVIRKTTTKIVFGKPHDSSDKESDLDELIFEKKKTGMKILEKLAYDRKPTPYDGIIPYDVLKIVIIYFNLNGF
jgi:hypothetical protein